MTQQPICHSIYKLFLALFLCSWFLVACGIPARAGLTTRFNSLGGGQHKMVLAVPVTYYDGAVFNRLPDFSLITGVSVKDYQQGNWQGMEVSQSFMRLQSLNGTPEEAHFLNQAFPGSTPLLYRVSWEPGLFTRSLRVQVFTNSSRSNALAESVALTSLSALEAEYILEMPGPVITHNGQLRHDRAVFWEFDASTPQVMEATARVTNWPMIMALLFTASCVLLVVFVIMTNQGSGANGSRGNHAGSVSRGGQRPLPPPRRR